MFKSLGFDLFSSNWVVGVKKNSTLSTNILFRDSISDAGNSGQWAWVCSALGGRCPLETNVTSLTPGASPAVTHDPVVSILSISSISNKLDSWKKDFKGRYYQIYCNKFTELYKICTIKYYNFNKNFVLFLRPSSISCGFPHLLTRWIGVLLNEKKCLLFILGAYVAS